MEDQRSHASGARRLSVANTPAPARCGMGNRDSRAVAV